MMQGYGIRTMIVSGLVVVCLLSVALSAFINLHKFNTAFDQVINDRFYFAMGEGKKLIEAEMRLGQSFGNLQVAQNVLDDLKAVDPKIVSVELFDEKGRTLYSTDNSYLFDFVPKAWESAWVKAPLLPWVVNGSGNIVLGLGVNDALNRPAGAIALVYQSSLKEGAFQAIQQKLVLYGLWIVGAASLALIVAVIIFTRALKAYLRRMEEELVQEGECQNVDVQTFHQAYQGAITLLDDTARELEAIDEGQKSP